MALDVALMTFPEIEEISEFAFERGNISFGEAQSEEIPLNYGGNIERVNIRRRQLQLTVIGALDTDVVALENKRQENVRAMINREDIGVTVSVAGITMEKMYLANVEPSGTIRVEGTEILEQMTLTYNARRWS